MKIVQTIRNLDKVLGTIPETKSKVSKPRPPPAQPARPLVKEKHMDMMTFAEVVNARAAITGQIIGPLVFMETGMPLTEQVSHPECALLVSVWCLYIAMSSRLTWDFYNQRGIFETVEISCGQISMLLFMYYLFQIVD
jgi:hypothetical protein